MLRAWFEHLSAQAGRKETLDLLRDLPYSVRGVRDSFAGSGSAWWFYGLAALGVMLLGYVWWRYGRGRNKGREDRKMTAEGLFEELVERLGLTTQERRLVKEMARGARLRHPAMCLLSPGLMEWTRQLWRQEAGESAVTPAKTAAVAEIALKLHDFHATRA